jgi:hypothetical protein
LARPETELVTYAKARQVTTIILPGYNADGAALVPVLYPALVSSNVIAYQLPRWGFDQQAVVKRIVGALGNTKLVVYAESAGALDVAAMLRTFPELHVDHLILNAGMSSWRDIAPGAPLILSRIIQAGIVPTWLLQWNQRKSVVNSPTWDLGIDERAAIFAEHTSLGVTASQARGEVRRIFSTRPVQDDEFTGRVLALTYMGSTNGCNLLADRDPFVRLAQACLRWERATRLDATIVLPPTWAGLHTPTPEKPGPVIQVLSRAIGNLLNLPVRPALPTSSRGAAGQVLIPQLLTQKAGSLPAFCVSKTALKCVSNCTTKLFKA